MDTLETGLSYLNFQLRQTFNSKTLVIATLTNPHSQPITVSLLNKLKLSIISYYNVMHKDLFHIYHTNCNYHNSKY